MACLSVVENGGKAFVVANPIFLISSIDDLRNGVELTFEVFEQDAAKLVSLVGKPQYFTLESKTFWAKLKTLDSCKSTHQGLAYLRDKPTLRGVLAIFEEAPPRQ